MNEDGNIQNDIFEIKMLCQRTATDIEYIGKQLNDIKSNTEKDIGVVRADLKELSEKHQKLSNEYNFIKSGAIILSGIAGVAWLIFEAFVNHFWHGS